MSTLQQIRERVSRKLQDPSNTSRSAAVVDDEINRSIRYYSRYRFSFNEGEANITLTSGQQTVPNLPADLLSPLFVNGLTLIDDQVKIDLHKLLPDAFREGDNDQTGRPVYYTIINEQFLLNPTPIENYTLKFRYLKKYDDLVNNTDTNDFTEIAEDLIMLHTLKNMYAEDKQDTEYANFYQVLEQSELRSLRERTDAYNASGYLTGQTILGADNIY